MFLRFLRLVVALVAMCVLPQSSRAEEPLSLLSRDVIELRLATVPAARVSCTLRALGGGVDGNSVDEKFGSDYGETKTVQWAPEGDQPLIRTIRVRAKLEWWISCGSEPLPIVGASGGSSQQPSAVYHYRFERKTPPCGFTLDGRTTKVAGRLKNAECTKRPTFFASNLELRDAVTDRDGGSVIRFTASIKPAANITISPGNDQTQIASERSIVSFDQVLKDLASAVADVAVEKARSNAEALLQDKIASVFCSDLSLQRLWQQAGAGSELSHWLPGVDGRFTSADVQKVCTPDNIREDCHRPLFENTCQTVKSVRVAEMAASGEALRRAVTSDLARLALNRMETGTFGDEKRWPGVPYAIHIVSAFIQRILLTDGDITQKQAQALLFSLASETGNIGNAHGDWRDTFVVAVAIVSECLEQGDCTIDQMQRLWNQEDWKQLATAVQRNELWRKALAARARADVVDLDANGLAEINAAYTDELVLLRTAMEETSKLEAERKELGSPGDRRSGAMKAQLMKREAGVRAAQEALFSGNAAAQREGLQRDGVLLSSAGLQAIEQRLSLGKEKLQPALDAARRLEVIDNLLAWKDQYLILLSNVRDVLRPPPGTTERETVGRSLSIAFSVLEMALTFRKDRLDEAQVKVIRRQFTTLRAIVNAMVKERYGEAIQHGGAVISDLITQSCRISGKNCPVAITSKQAEKWFGVLGAFASYSASYAGGAAQGLSGEALTKYQAEQRKAAMADLIDAATDRRGRARDWVFSTGVAVQTTIGHRVEGTDKGRYAGLALPTGVALQLLPGGDSLGGVFGVHAQLSLLDLGQFVTVSEKELASPSAATPFYFGGQLGVLVGAPKYNALIAIDGGYAPGMDYVKDEDGSTGGWRIGGSIGMYVPFIDFN